MVATTGCASRSYPKHSGQPADALLNAFIVINESVLAINESVLFVREKSAKDGLIAAERARRARFKELKGLAAGGTALEQRELADCYFYGQGTLRDADLATFWYRQSAEQALPATPSAPEAKPAPR
jgi:TPR repeat protein